MKTFISVTLFIALTLILHVNGEEMQHQINLEDIERDNILNERKMQQTKGSDNQSKQQNFRPSEILYSPSSNDQQQKQEKVVYSHTGSQVEDNRYHNNNQFHNHRINYQDGDQQVQYVTPPSTVQDHRFSPHEYVSSAVQPNLIQTYKNNYHGRQTPFKPIIPNQNTHLHQQEPQIQPQFVYLHSTKTEGEEEKQNEQGTIQHSALGGIQYATPQDIDAYTIIREDEQASELPKQSKVTREQSSYQHQQQHHQGQAAGATGFLQYVPLIARGPSPNEAYIMMAPLPAGYLKDNNKPLTVTPSVIAYSHSAPPSIIPIVPIPHPNAIHPYAPIPPTALPLRGGIQYLNSNELQGPNLESHAAPAQDIQYANQNEITTRPKAIAEKSKQHLFAPRHPERQGQAAPQPQDLSKLHSLDTHKVIPLHYPRLLASPLVQPIQPIHPLPLPPPAVNPLQALQFLHPVAYNQISPTIDLFSNRKAKSLLDSYIPSWVVLQKQRSINQNNLPQEYTSSAATNAYNTIAYSVPESQGQRLIYYSGVHFKRSPKDQKVLGA